MYRFLLLFMLVVNSLTAEDTYQMTLTDQADTARNIRLQIDLQVSELKGPQLDIQSVENDIKTRLQLGQIKIVDDPASPLLSLRVKSINVDAACASFVQLAFYEEGYLKRSESPIMVLTWSQASLLASEKDEYVKEVSNSISSMVTAFILDYQKAFTKKKQ